MWGRVIMNKEETTFKEEIRLLEEEVDKLSKRVTRNLSWSDDKTTTYIDIKASDKEMELIWKKAITTIKNYEPTKKLFETKKITPETIEKIYSLSPLAAVVILRKISFTNQEETRKAIFNCPEHVFTTPKHWKNELKMFVALLDKQFPRILLMTIFKEEIRLLEEEAEELIKKLANEGDVIMVVPSHPEITAYWAKVISLIDNYEPVKKLCEEKKITEELMTRILEQRPIIQVVILKRIKHNYADKEEFMTDMRNNKTWDGLFKEECEQRNPTFRLLMDLPFDLNDVNQR